MAALLPVSRAIRALSLAHNDMLAPGALALAPKLCGNASLAELDLTGNRVGPRGATALVEAVASGPVATLRVLRLGSNAIGDGAAAALRRLLGCSGALATLALPDNGMGEATAVAIASALETPACALRELDLSWNLLRAVPNLIIT